MENIFWSDRRNKSKFFNIFHFLGLEMTKYFMLNKCIHEAFYKEFKKIKEINNHSKALLQKYEDLESLFSKDSLLIYTLSQFFTEDRNILKDKEIMPQYDEVNRNKRMLNKLLILKNIYHKFQIELINGNIIINQKTNENLITMLNMYLDINHYLDNSIVIKKLEISNSSISERQLKMIKTYTERKNSKIQSLKLKNNLWTINFCELIAELIKEGINELAIFNSNFKSDEKIKIFSAIKENQNLSKLSLRCLNLEDQELLKDSLNKISYLDLSHSQFSIQSVYYLVNNLKNNQNLSYLNLRGINMDTLNTRRLSLFLKSNTRLEELDVSSTFRSQNNISFLFRCLAKYNHTLKILRVELLSFAELYVEFYKFIKMNKGVQSIYLGENLEMKIEDVLKRMARFYLQEDLRVSEVKTKICRRLNFINGSNAEISCKSERYFENNCFNHIIYMNDDIKIRNTENRSQCDSSCHVSQKELNYYSEDSKSHQPLVLNLNEEVSEYSD